MLCSVSILIDIQLIIGKNEPIVLEVAACCFVDGCSFTFQNVSLEGQSKKVGYNGFFRSPRLRLVLHQYVYLMSKIFTDVITGPVESSVHQLVGV